MEWHHHPPKVNSGIKLVVEMDYRDTNLENPHWQEVLDTYRWRLGDLYLRRTASDEMSSRHHHSHDMHGR